MRDPFSPTRSFHVVLRDGVALRRVFARAGWLGVLAVCLGLAVGCGSVRHDPGAGASDTELPDALVFFDGRPVATRADWAARKAEIRERFCDVYLGHFPETPPKLLSADVVRAIDAGDGSTRERVRLTFDTPNRQSFEIEVWRPAAGGGPARRPLLLTQPRQYQRERWGEQALARGYVVCLYPGLDVHHREPAYPGYENVWKRFQGEYPEATWASSLGIQAWLASRALDYLLDPAYGYRIDGGSVGITGFSRYGKQAIYAAAFDERFTAVVARSPGSPAACPYRYSGRETFMESPRDAPGPWLKDRARSYYGREHALPVEANALLACIAPRRLMIDTAHNDGAEPTFGVERAYRDAKNVWALFGKEENITLSYRPGNHHPITDEQVRRNLDYFDLAFGRGDARQDDFPERLLHAFDWRRWEAKQRPSDLTVPANASVREQVRWMLGEPPNAIEHAGQYRIKTGEELGVPDASRDRWNPGGIRRVPFSFSGRMHGNIFFDPDRDDYKATVIWLHPWNYSHGSNEGYGVRGTTIYYRLAQQGYKVVMYDQLGFGDHLIDGVGFYDRHPRWSRLGRAVHDVSAAIDFVVEGKGVAAEPVPPTDPGRVYLCGFAYGGLVGLYAAALDERVAGLACFSGFTPMRDGLDAGRTGDLRRLWQTHAVLPKLSLFENRRAALPYDYDDLLKLVAPRPCLVYAPARDRFANAQAVRAAVERARPAWPNADALAYMQPDDICRFQRAQQDAALAWLDGVVGKQPPAGPISRQSNTRGK